MELSIVLPCFNEEENIRGVTQKALAWIAREGLSAEIILVNDGSSDATGKIIDELAGSHYAVHAMHHEKNQGYGSAIRTGVDRAHGDRIAWMDSDGQFDPADLRLLLSPLSKVPFVAGIREKRADPKHRELYGKIYAFIIGLILGITVKDINCGMRMFKSEIWEKIRPQHGSGALINAEVFLRMKRNNIAWKQVPVPHYPRTAGSPTGSSFRVIIKMFRDLFLLRIKR